MRGRKPKPVELKLVEGTYRKDRAPADTPRQRASAPHTPDWFDEEHLREWKKLARHYREQGRSIQPHELGIHVGYITLLVQLSRANRELFAAEAAILDSLKHASLPGFEHAMVQAPGPLQEQRDRLIRRVRALTQELKAVASELGLTPSARSRAGWGKRADGKPAPSRWSTLGQEKP